MTALRWTDARAADPGAAAAQQRREGTKARICNLRQVLAREPDLSVEGYRRPFCAWLRWPARPELAYLSEAEQRSHYDADHAAGGDRLASAAAEFETAVRYLEQLESTKHALPARLVLTP
jgi:hypothetical protein